MQKPMRTFMTKWLGTQRFICAATYGGATLVPQLKRGLQLPMLRVNQSPFQFPRASNGSGLVIVPLKLSAGHSSYATSKLYGNWQFAEERHLPVAYTGTSFCSIYLSEVCWCGETQKSKQSAIDEGTAKIQELAAEIEQGIALSSRLGPEIDSLKSEFEKNAAALKQAAAIREKQSTEFEEQSKDLAESISAVKKALKVMSKKETKESKESVSFLQTSRSSEVSSALREVFVRSRRPVAGSSRKLRDWWRSGRGCIVQV